MSSKTIYHFVYETTNLVNGKVYRGVHLTDNLDDGYLGSGTRFIKALNKYGKDKFKREIIFWAFDRDSADWAEEQLVSEEWLDLGNTNMPIRISPMKGKKKQK